MIKLIVAMDETGLIGSNTAKSGMPWYNKEDLAYFKQTTLSHAIVMGRKTFEKIDAPLEKRKVHVVSHQQGDPNLQEVITYYQLNKQDLYICGGAHIYQQALPYVEEILISIIPGKHIGEIYFPAWNENDFKLVATRDYATFTLKRYRRITK